MVGRWPLAAVACGTCVARLAGLVTSSVSVQGSYLAGSHDLAMGGSDGEPRRVVVRFRCCHFCWYRPSSRRWVRRHHDVRLSSAQTPRSADDPGRAQGFGQRYSFQNDSVPLSANLSTWWRGTCVNEQLPSGARTKSARPLTVPLGPDRLPPGPCLLTGVSAEAPGSSVTSRVRSLGTFHPCSLPCGHSHP